MRPIQDPTLRDACQGRGASGGGLVVASWWPAAVSEAVANRLRGVVSALLCRTPGCSGSIQAGCWQDTLA